MGFCAMVGCSSQSGRHPGIRLYTVPSIISRSCPRTYEVTSRRRWMWLSRISRKELFRRKGEMKVCSKHFVQGRPAKRFQENDVDWAPSLNLGYSLKESGSPLKNGKQKASAFACHQRIQRRQNLGDSLQERSPSFADSSSAQENYCSNQGDTEGSALKEEAKPSPIPLLTTSEDHLVEKIPNTVVCVGSPSCGGTTTQTHPNGRDIDLLVEKCTKLEKEQLLWQEINTLLSNDNVPPSIELFKMTADLKKVFLTDGRLQNDDAKVRFFTGLPTWSLLRHVYSFVESSVSHGPHNALPKFSEFLLVMIRLRLGLLVEDLAFRFNVSAAAVSKIVDKWLPIMAVRLSSMIVWPDGDILQATMPACFQEAFGSRIAVIVDCFEILIDRPRSLIPRAETSTYKDHKTNKFLIGITPQGSVCFISRVWDGQSSDKHITLSSGFLDQLAPGDVVLPDRGFTISEEVGMLSAELEIPAFTKGKMQFSFEDVRGKRSIANVRIHVERIIGFVRRKFRILSSVLPISILTSRRENDDAPIDCILKICCALANLCPPLMEQKKYCFSQELFDDFA